MADCGEMKNARIGSLREDKLTIEQSDQREKAIGHLLNTIQVTLHRLLNEYINGYSLKRMSKLLYPFRQQNQSNLVSQLRELAELACQLERISGLSFPSGLAAWAKVHADSCLNESDLAHILSAYYSDFTEIVDSITSAPYCARTVRAARLFDPELLPQGDKAYLAPLCWLNSYIRRYFAEYVLDVYLHGSMATGDYIRYSSDVDVLVVLRRDTVCSPSHLRAFRKHALRTTQYFLFIDPFQHHGYLVITEQDLLYYPEPFFPLVIFRYAQSLLHNRSLSVWVRPWAAEAMEALLKAVLWLRDISQGQRVIKTLYQLKALNHLILLLPATFLQAIGQPVYKRDSFALARPYFQQEEWLVIELASQLRAQWRSRLVGWHLWRWLAPVNPNPFWPGLLHRLIMDQSNPALVTEFAPRLSALGRLLAERMLEYARSH